MKKTLLFKFIALSLFMLFGVGVVNAQTTLTAGDIAIIGYNGDAPDGFAFVTLIELASGTEIRFTDSGVLTSGAFRTGEGAVKYTAPSVIAAGTVITCDISNLASLPANFTRDDDAVIGTNGMNISSSGDQIIAFQGASLTPVFIYAVNNEGTSVWQSDATSSNTSALPPGLTEGTTAIALNEVDNATYNGLIISDTKANLLTAISTSTNWNTNDATAYTFSFSNFTVTSENTAAADLFFSEYIEGTSSNRAVEIFNGTGAAVDLSAYSVKQSYNGEGWGIRGGVAMIEYVLPLSGTLADGDVFVFYNSDATNAKIIAEGDLALTYAAGTAGCRLAAFTGDDALGLFKGDVLIDIIGVVNIDPGSGWDVAGVAVATVDHTLVRKRTVNQGNTNWTAVAGTNADDSEWIVNAIDQTDNLGTHTFGEEPPPTTIPVTFNVDMNNATFVAGTDHLYIAGTMAGNWTSPGDVTYEMTDANSDGIYTITLELDAAGEIKYKYFINSGWDGGEWVGDPDRKTTITEATTLNDVFGKYIYNVDLGATTFYAGDNVTFTWASKGVDNVKIEVWLPGESTWMELIASSPSDGTEPFEIPVNADSEVGLIIRISDVTNSNVFAVSAAFELIGTPTIFDIQSDVEEGTDISWFKGQKVRTSGVVTAIAGANFWLQMPNNLKLSVYPEWSGILCYHTATAAALTVGDNVTLIATVDEYYGATELVNVVSYVINSQGNVINPTNVTAFDATEAYESTLITIIDAKVHTTPDTYGEFKINDGTADYIIDDKMYSYTPIVGNILSITGVTTYANSNFKLYPRSANDVVVTGGVGIEDLTETEISIYPNPSNGKFFVQMGSAFKSNTKIEIF
ncbi:MAG: lamin tail domain-containing protein, partial [Bacteroidota bacterium]